MCKAAVAQNGLALEHASQEMKGDREVCKAAVAQAAQAGGASSVIKHVSKELWKDEAFVLSAVGILRSNGYEDGKGGVGALGNWIPIEIQQNENVRKAGLARLV